MRRGSGLLSEETAEGSTASLRHTSTDHHMVILEKSCTGFIFNFLLDRFPILMTISLLTVQSSNILCLFPFFTLFFPPSLFYSSLLCILEADIRRKTFPVWDKESACLQHGPEIAGLWV